MSLELYNSVLTDNERLRRENSILRHELKIRLVNEFIENYEFSEDEAEEAAEREITGIVLHNEGTE